MEGGDLIEVRREEGGVRRDWTRSTAIERDDANRQSELLHAASLETQHIGIYALCVGNVVYHDSRTLYLSKLTTVMIPGRYSGLKIS